MQKLEVRLLEQGLGGAVRVRGVGDDDVESVLVLVEELEAVADVHLDLGVVETLGHAGEVLLREANNGLLFINGVRALPSSLRTYASSRVMDRQPGRPNT